MRNRRFVPGFARCEDRIVQATAIGHDAIVAAAVQGIGTIRQADFAAVPLDELTGTYLGKTGGLYGDGKNEVPSALTAAADTASLAIRPLDTRGNPSPTGKIGVLAIGQSTTRMVFDAFRSAARSARASNVVLINGALDGNDSEDWAKRSGPWNEAIKRVNQSGTNARQVQVLWVEATLMFPARFGAFTARNATFVSHLEQITNQARQRFPNLKLIYFSSRYYGGWATKQTSPEPFAYETAFGIRDFVLSKVPQSTGSPIAAVSKPVVLWGPYFWTSGTTASKVDGLSLNRSDLVADGVHPSATGAAKFADQLLRFFTGDRSAKRWFTGSPA